MARFAVLATGIGARDSGGARVVSRIGQICRAVPFAIRRFVILSWHSGHRQASRPGANSGFRLAQPWHGASAS
jgi:hypothetical protein